MSNNDNLRVVDAIRKELGEEIYNKILDIKNHYDLNSDLDVLKTCIEDAYRIVEMRSDIHSSLSDRSDLKKREFK